MTIEPEDIMDVSEVAEAFGLSKTSIHVAITQPDKFRALADRLPPPLRKVSRAWVWRRDDIERALATPEETS